MIVMDHVISQLMIYCSSIYSHISQYIIIYSSYSIDLLKYPNVIMLRFTVH